MYFSNQIIQWYNTHKRDLPWRNTKDPYHIWLSEIMLQQTRVNQGLPYYLRFLEHFPTVHDLAKADEEKVLKLWQGLGYYSRARNLHKTAQFVSNELGGQFPDTKKELLKLKGVGDYTSSAIASFAFNEATPVVDGNVNRVLSRFFGIDEAVNEKVGQTLIQEKAQLVLNAKKPAQHNQAIMEFGALQCKPKNPYCNLCPLQSKCVAFQQGMVEQLPVKLKKTKVQTRYLSYYVIVDDFKKTILQQRKGKGIWENLFEFPVVEQNKEPNIQVVEDEYEKLFNFKNSTLKKMNQEPIVHNLSHRKLIANFYLAEVAKVEKKELENHQQLTKLAELEKLPVPVLIANFIKDFLL
jgi:A/G-specific adenine glycosylase